MDKDLHTHTHTQFQAFASVCIQIFLMENYLCKTASPKNKQTTENGNSRSKTRKKRKKRLAYIGIPFVYAYPLIQFNFFVQVGGSFFPLRLSCSSLFHSM